MAVRNAVRDEAQRLYDLVGGVDRRPIGWVARLRNRIEKLPPVWGGLLVVGIGGGLYIGAIAGVEIALAGNGSLLAVLVGIPVLTMSATIAAHLTPPRISDLLE